MEQYVSLNPMSIGFLRSITVVAHADRLAQLVEQFWLVDRWRRLNTDFGIQSAIDDGERAICRRILSDVIHNRLRVMSLVVEHGQFAGSPERSVNVRSSDAGKTLKAVDKLPPGLQPSKCSVQKFTVRIKAAADHRDALEQVERLERFELLELSQQSDHPARDAKFSG